MHPNLPPYPDARPLPPEIEASLVLNGIAAWRYRRAENIVEKMDHKDRLYKSLGNITVPDSDQAEREQTLPERIKGVFLDRRASKRIEAENNAFRTRRIHGIDRSEPVPSIRKAVIDSTAGRIPGSAMDGPEISVAGAVYENAKRVLVGADIDGYSRIKRIIERADNRWKFIVGKKTAYEASVRKDEIMAKKLKLGAKTHRQTRRQDRRRAESLELASQQPILSVWRSQRRARAIRRIEHIEHEHASKNKSTGT